MFRLAFGIACVLLIWLQSLFTDTVQIDGGDTHVFQYNWVPWFFLVLMMLVLVGCAEDAASSATAVAGTLCAVR